MNSIPVFPLPALTTRQQSMYQQTYLERNRMVTDVFVQEHVSQSSWSLGAPTVFVPNSGGLPHSAPQQASYMAYMAMPGMQYYAASSASMNAYGQGQIYSARASATSTCNMAGFYMPHYYPNSGGAAPPPTQQCATQTQTPVKISCDVGTQADLVNEEQTSQLVKNVEAYSQTSAEYGAGDGLHAQSLIQGLRRNSDVTLSEQRLMDITRIALQGSELAERLANAHRNRPCFKKIDTLCARLKQDLLRPDGVLPNINSQGIAWAVKDFIFVFTRIVNAWVILKGYVYNTPEGLNKIKDELPRGFMATFDSWQMCTFSLVEMIITSFVNLDDLLQKQKNCFASGNNSSIINNSEICALNRFKTQSGGGPTAFSTPNDPSFGSKDQSHRLVGSAATPTNNNKLKCSLNLSYLYTMIEDSEETQRNVNANGTYLKTGTYQPLQKEFKNTDGRMLPQPTAVRQPMSNMENILEQSRLRAAAKPPQVEPMPTVAAKTDSMINFKPFLNPFSVVGREVVRQLNEFGDRVIELQHIERFFQKQFTRNYYPDFYMRCKHDFIDVRAIILKCESASYHHVYQAIHDMRRILFVGRCYLKIYYNDNLEYYLDLYERSVNDMLAKPPNLPNQYDHIVGRPGEKLFNYEI